MSGFSNDIPNNVGASVDAFGRIRISSPFTLFESKQLFDNRSIVWSTSLNSSATSTHNSNRASTTLSVTSTVGSSAVRQTKSRSTYQSGKSLLIMNTFVFGSTPGGITKRVGYFDGYNGLFVQHNGTNLSFVVRSNITGIPIDTLINQSNWNFDKFDGTGPSGLVLDITKAQIFVIDLEWLGTGRVRFGFNIDGVVHYGHFVLNANNIGSVYMSSPNLPIRYEITNVSSSGSSTLEQICSGVFSEGGFENKGYVLSVDRGASVLSGVDNTALYPLVSIRLDTSKQGSVVTPEGIHVLCSTANSNFKWALLLNPTIAGSDASSWQSVSNSIVQYDISRTLSNTLSGGTVLHSGYANQTIAVDVSFNTLITLGVDLSNVSDQMILAVQKIGTGTDSFIGAMSWREII